MVEKELCDPSENTIKMIDNMVCYFKDSRAMDQKYNEDRLNVAIESSRRERVMESERINALRKVDVDAVAVANDRAIVQAQLLNDRMLDNADVLRKSVEATATTIATQFEKMTTTQNERIAALERINSENLGKSSVSPDLQELVSQLIAAQNIAKGRSGLSLPLLLTIAGLLGGVLMKIIDTFF